MSAVTEPLLDLTEPTIAAENRSVSVCAVDLLVPGRGVAALIDGQQVAVFLTEHHGLFAVGNHDPISDTNVLSRGITGSINGEPVVASPIYKQRFSLRTGICLDDPAYAVPVYRIETIDGMVHVHVVS